ncbi:MAG TPA: phospholipase D-like domain-containing protein [Candidatus Angelobacter sp.]|nr:phospholipase D-like domain-containing protein [Candidatus Angelobacter sp.]
MASKRVITPEHIDKVITRNLKRLRKPGVLTVRPGFEIRKHQLTGKQAIVATVNLKTKSLPRNELLPAMINNIPVDVREGTAHQRLRAHDAAAAALSLAFGRPEQKEPVWPLEREMPSGHLLNDPQSSTQQQLATTRQQRPMLTQALQAHSAKNQIPYVAAPNTPLTPFTTTATITAHVSPDAALKTLTQFLQGTQHTLVIGMYDFTSGPILGIFESVLTGGKTLQMVLDNPPPNHTRNQTDTQTVQELEAAMGGRARIVRALAGDDVFADAIMFTTSYHIKVIVRDGSAVWISSGNLNNSNQPDLAHPPATEDRDWHVIIEDAQLSKVFTAYLDQDFKSASQHQAAPPAALASAVADAHAKAAAEANPAPAAVAAAKGGKLVPAQVFPNVQVKITPLLTPDTVGPQKNGQYLTNIISLINGAKHKLYIQLQYIEASSGTGDDFDKLLRAIRERVAAGVEVRLIESQQFGEKWAEKMKSQGVDLTANIFLQPDVHNKGFVVDSSTVVVSSQNFSPAGVQTNRDAGVIIESAPIAQYFEKVFLADLKTRAKPFDPNAPALKVKPAGGSTPHSKKKGPAKPKVKAHAVGRR